MYHSISNASEEGVSPYYRTCTSPKVFAQQMALLKSLGCQGVTLSAGLSWLGSSETSSQPSTLNPQPVAITFDDGFHDFYSEAAPVLKSHGFSATMFLPTAFIQDHDSPPSPTPVRIQENGAPVCNRLFRNALSTAPSRLKIGAPVLAPSGLQFS